MSEINPQISEVKHGVRELVPLKLYPLSIADQFEMEAVINTVVSEFMSSDDDSELSFISFIIGLIKENFKKILVLVTDHTTDAKIDKLLKNMTNDQMTEIAVRVYQMNFEGILKKVVGLLEKFPVESLLRGPLPQSSKNTQDSDLSTSTDSPLEMVDLPTDS